MSGRARDVGHDRSRPGRGFGPARGSGSGVGSGQGPGPTPHPGPWTTSTGVVEWVREREEGAWTLYVNGVPSSPLRQDDPRILDFEYMAWMASILDATVPEPAPLRALHLGGGACSFPRYLAASRPDSRQIVVELDEELVRRLREWVDLPRAPALRLRVGEAREQLAQRPDASADVVVRDVFAGDSTPRHVCTVEFTADVARVVAPSGLYLANVVARTSPVGQRDELASVREVFEHVALVAEPGVLRGRRHGNTVVVAGHEELPVAAITRALGGGAAPARLVHGPALVAISAGGRPVRDG